MYIHQASNPIWDDPDKAPYNYTLSSTLLALMASGGNPTQSEEIKHKDYPHSSFIPGI